jgi:ribosome modulation factor
MMPSQLLFTATYPDGSSETIRITPNITQTGWSANVVARGKTLRRFRYTKQASKERALQVASQAVVDRLSKEICCWEITPQLHKIVGGDRNGCFGDEPDGKLTENIQDNVT